MAGQLRLDEALEKDPSSSCCSSKFVAETVNGSHQFIVEGYSLVKGMERGKYMSSDIFSVGGYDWEIRFYPDGFRPEDIFKSIAAIALVSDDTNVKALLELKLQDQSGDEEHYGFSQSAPCTMKEKGWLLPCGVPKAMLETPKFVVNDRLVIKATVGIVTTRREKVERVVVKRDCVTVPDPNLGQGLKELLESGVGCDVVFRVGGRRGGETFKAHKLILAARSPFFKAQFFGPAGDPNLNEVIVDDIHPSIFKAMLRFIYTDELPDAHDMMMSSSSSSMSSGATNITQHLLVAADLYNLDRLKLFCESKLCEELTVVSVATTLALAEQHQCAQLKAACLKFAAIPANLVEMMQSEGFKHLEESCPTLLGELLKKLASTNDGFEGLTEGVGV